LPKILRRFISQFSIDDKLDEKKNVTVYQSSITDNGSHSNYIWPHLREYFQPKNCEIVIAISAIVFLNIATFVVPNTIPDDVKRFAENTTLISNRLYPCDFNLLSNRK
jgi:hypothetical protein